MTKDTTTQYSYNTTTHEMQDDDASKLAAEVPSFLRSPPRITHNIDLALGSRSAVISR